jgi:hypothetical protein
MVKRCFFVVSLLGGCQSFSFSMENRPCGENNACLPGYLCSQVTQRCVKEGSAQVCVPTAEIACNGIDEDCNGVDSVESGTVNNCGGCNDSCRQAFVAQSACVSLTCVIERCDDNHVDADGDPANGCERSCQNVDGDNICDEEDTCVDKDGDGLGNGVNGNVGCVVTVTDTNDNDPTVCADTDSDGCDDCSSGTFAPLNDGIDLNGNGICNVTDIDEDGDGVPWWDDLDDGNPQVCRDIDNDTCDDCSGPGPTADPANDGPDFDGDGLCDAGDPDDDNDTVLDAEDVAPQDPTRCQDLDDDGCDDCTRFTTYNAPNFFDDGEDFDRDGACGDETVNDMPNSKHDCNDGIPTCIKDCSDSPIDVDELPECEEVYCTTRLDSPGSQNELVKGICRAVEDAGDLAQAMTERLTSEPTYILIRADITLTDTLSIDGVADYQRVVIHQKAGTKITVNFSSKKDVFVATGGNHGNEFYDLNIAPTGTTANVGTVFKLQSNNNVVERTTIAGFGDRAIGVIGANGALVSGNRVAFNLIRGGTAAYHAESNTGGIVVHYASNTNVVGNIIRGTAMNALAVGASSGTRIDHNLFYMRDVATPGAAIHFYKPSSHTSTDSCARNNIATKGAATGRPLLTYENENDTTWLTGCSAANLFDASANTDWCNAHADEGGVCADLPNGFFSLLIFSGASDLRQTTDPASPGFMCLSNTQLIDSANFSAIAGVDMNGPYISAGFAGQSYFGNEYNGARPEPGAREHRTPYCP